MRRSREMKLWVFEGNFFKDRVSGRKDKAQRVAD
jgi:hypothetical protein